VIGVANSHKNGGLVRGSSRGTPADERLVNSDILDDYAAPTITAPGHGREFAADTKFHVGHRFHAFHYQPRRQWRHGGHGNPNSLPTLLHTDRGTSMATPFVAGTVALMLDADATLTNDTTLPADWLAGNLDRNRMDDIKRILTSTATRCRVMKSGKSAPASSMLTPPSIRLCTHRRTTARL